MLSLDEEAMAAADERWTDLPDISRSAFVSAMLRWCATWTDGEAAAFLERWAGYRFPTPGKMPRSEIAAKFRAEGLMPAKGRRSAMARAG